MLELLSEHACFGGVQRFYRHDAQAIGLPMRFSAFIPDTAPGATVSTKRPALFYLAGLTCTEETFMIKGGAQRVAAEEGLILIAPDTSPRGANIAGESGCLGFRRGRRLLRRCHRSAVEQPLPHVQLHPGTARPAGTGTGDRCATHGYFRPLDGRPRRAGAGLAQPGTVPLRVRLRAHRRTEPVSVGQEGLYGLPGQRCSQLAAVRRQRADARPARQAGTISRRHLDRPGPGRQVPARATVPRGVRSGMPRRRPALAAAPPCRL